MTGDLTKARELGIALGQELIDAAQATSLPRLSKWRFGKIVRSRARLNPVICGTRSARRSRHRMPLIEIFL